MNLSREDWNEWYNMDTTKQFIKELEQTKQDLLDLIYKYVLNYKEGEAVVCAGELKQLNAILEIIHSKTESVNE